MQKTRRTYRTARKGAVVAGPSLTIPTLTPRQANHFHPKLRQKDEATFPPAVSSTGDLG